MMRTDVVVKVFSDKGKEVLLRNKAEEQALKKKYGGVTGFLKLKRLPKEEQTVIAARLITQHAFYNAKEDNNFCHRIIGNSLFTVNQQKDIENKIRNELLKDGLKEKDFEVCFYDEQQ